MTHALHTRLLRAETAWAKRMVARIRQLPPDLVLARLLGIEPAQLPTQEEMGVFVDSPAWAELCQQCGYRPGALSDAALERSMLQRGVPDALRDLLA